MTLDFLNRKQEVVIPVGGDFQPSGFVGQWHAAVMTTFMTDMDLKAEGIAFDASRQMGQSGYIRYYWHDYDAAVQAAEDAGQEYKPGTVWCFESDVSTIFFSDESVREKFGTQLTYDGCRITTLRSRKYRHELHMIALPAAVQAYARANGWDVPELPFAELLSQDTAFTDDFQFRMIGHPDRDDYEESELWQYRVALWNALGEDNPKAYKLAGSDTKYDAGENNLNEALGILHYSWNAPVWGRMIPIPDPRVDATYESNDQTRRLSIPALTEIFASKKEAEEAASTETTTSTTTGTTTTTDGALALPAEWTDYPDDWKGIVRDLKASGPKPVVIKKLREGGTDDIAATVEDVEAWWDAV